MRKTKSKPSSQATLAAKSRLWDALASRLLSAKLAYSRGRLVVEADDPRQAAAVLERVLGVLASPSEAHD